MLQVIIDIYLSNPVAQTIGIIAATILTASGMIQDDKKMLNILTASLFFWSIHFYFLELYTASFLYGFMLVRNIIMFQYPQNKWLFIVFFMIPIVSLGFTYKGHLDVLATCAPLVFIYSVYFLKGLKLRMGMVIISIIWLYYSYAGNSIGGVLTEVFYLIGITVGIMKIYLKSPSQYKN